MLPATTKVIVITLILMRLSFQAADSRLSNLV